MELFFCCDTPSGCVWLTGKDVIAKGASEKLRKFIQKIWDSHMLPSRGAVSVILAGPPCQDISLANPHGERKNVMETDQVRTIQNTPSANDFGTQKFNHVVSKSAFDDDHPRMAF